MSGSQQAHFDGSVMTARQRRIRLTSVPTWSSLDTVSLLRPPTISSIMAMQAKLVISLLSLLAFFSSAKGCETLPSNLHIIKEIYGHGGQLERTCEGEVAVSKCEGTCHSKVRPSAISHSGFLKDCQCCRETSLRVRDVLLNKCYDPNGVALGGDKETYMISLREPTDCKCYRCGDATVL